MEALADRLTALSAEARSELVVYGTYEAMCELAELVPDIRTFSREHVLSCLKQYEFMAWTGFIPPSCHHTIVLLPLDYAPYLWGWPNDLVSDMQAVGTEVVLVGPMTNGDNYLGGIDDLETLDAIDPDYAGSIWTNRVELIGPIVR